MARSSGSLRPSRRSFLQARRATSRRRSAGSPLGEGFLLQGGDCAESFTEPSANNVSANNIRDFLRVFLQMAVVLTYAAALAGGEGRPHRRPVRQAAHLADREARRQGAAELSRRHHQRRRLHRGSARRPDPRRQIEAYRHSAATLNLLRAFVHGGYANLANVRQWTLGFVKDSPQSHHYEELADRITRGAGLHAGLRARPREPPRAQEHRVLHQPRGAAARLRAGDDARGFDAPRHLLLHLGPHAVDRRPHPPARSRARRVLPRHHQPDRAQVRSVDQARRAAAADRHPQSGERAGPPHADRAARRRQGRRPAAGHGPRGQARRHGRGVVVRSDARQHHHLGDRLQDPAVRPHPVGSEDASSRSTAPKARMAAACIWR